MNLRKKRCTDPACRRAFSYAPGKNIICPHCGKVWGRHVWSHFHFGVDPEPKALPNCAYTVQFDRLVEDQLLKAVKAYRIVCPVGLYEAAAAIRALREGRPQVLEAVSAEDLRLLMREGYMDFSYRPCRRPG